MPAPWTAFSLSLSVGVCGYWVTGHEYAYAFPLIFFNVEDFEDAFSNLVINDAEYLCVELRVRLPARDSSSGSSSGGGGSTADRNVTIFQGAVSWDAIHSTFQRQTTPKSICMSARSPHHLLSQHAQGVPHDPCACAAPRPRMAHTDSPDAGPGCRGAGRVHHDAGTQVQGPLPGGCVDHGRGGGRRARVGIGVALGVRHPARLRQDGPGMQTRPVLVRVCVPVRTFLSV
jgi:hypothetical protein